MRSSAFGSNFGEMVEVTENGSLWTLSPTNELVGNPLIPALHGGAVTAYLELVCGAVIARELKIGHSPQLVSVTVQFLASMRLAPVIARPQILRIGRRVAVVQVNAWQDCPAALVCTAQCEFYADPTAQG